MAVVLTTNTVSYNAQRHLSQTTHSIQRSYERLSSGLRIVRASDDAAGLSIASTLNVHSRIFNQGIKNVNDASSAFHIAEGALTELTSILIRIEELSEQASNGTLSRSQRLALNIEAQQIREEFNRIVSTTSFNNLTLLESDESRLDIQAGGNAVELSLIGPDFVSGDGTFKASLNFTVGSGPRSVTGEDLNRDGHTDLVTANWTSGDISVLTGNGDGTFKAAQTYAAGSNARWVEIEDVNGDSLADILCADRSGNSVSVFLGFGDGTFGPRRSFITGTGPVHIVASDLNRDGRKDLVVSEVGTSSVRLLFGNGDGSFSSAVSMPGVVSPNATAVADLNLDGIFDIVVADQIGDNLGVYIGNGNGTFKSRITYLAGNNPVIPVIKDLDNDGFFDLISVNRDSGDFSVMIGNGNGTFKAQQTNSAVVATLSGEVADVNGDGKVDMIFTNSVSGRVGVSLGNGDGTFRLFTESNTGSTPYDVFLSDLNSDGALDIVSADFGTTSISVLMGNTDLRSQLPTFNVSSQLSALETLDTMVKLRRTLGNSLGRLGAQQSRLQTVNSYLQISTENYQRSASQILDVDVAIESAELTRKEILQQSARAVLVQANQLPALALQLLSP